MNYELQNGAISLAIVVHLVGAKRQMGRCALKYFPCSTISERKHNKFLSIQNCKPPFLRCKADECSHFTHSKNGCIETDDGGYFCQCDMVGGWMPVDATNQQCINAVCIYTSLAPTIRFCSFFYFSFSIMLCTNPLCKGYCMR